MWDLWWTKWHWWPCHSRLPNAAARVRAQVRSCGICGGQSGTGGRYFRVLRFPLPILIPPTAPHSSSSSSGAGTIGQLVADVPRGLNLNPTSRNKKRTTLIGSRQLATRSEDVESYWTTVRFPIVKYIYFFDIRKWSMTLLTAQILYWFHRLFH
jgi:hypothetical protein